MAWENLNRNAIGVASDSPSGRICTALATETTHRPPRKERKTSFIEDTTLSTRKENSGSLLTRKESSGSLFTNNTHPISETVGPPDGGYGWVVTAVCFYNCFMAGGTILCYGIIYVEFLDYFQESRAKTSLIGGLTQISISLAGPVSSALSTRFSHRTVTIIGSLLATLGIASSAFAESIYFLYASYGLIGGFGLGLSVIPSIALVALYFDKRRSSAVALGMAGGAASLMVFPPMLDACIKHLTWRGTMFVLASLWMHVCIGGALMRPLTTRESVISERRMSRRYSIVSIKGRLSVVEVPIKETHILKTWRLWLFLLSEFLWRIDFMNFPTILPDFAVQNGHDKTNSGLLLTIFGAVLGPARIAGGYVADRPKINPILLLAFLISVSGLLSAVFPFTRGSYLAMAVISGARGAVNGALPILAPSILVILFSADRMTTAFGYGVIATGAGHLTAQPLGGIIFDSTGDYLSAYLTCAAIAFASAGLTFLLYVINRNRLIAQREKDAIDEGPPEEVLGLRRDSQWSRIS